MWDAAGKEKLHCSYWRKLRYFDAFSQRKFEQRNHNLAFAAFHCLQCVNKHLDEDDNIPLLFLYSQPIFVLGARGGNDANKDNVLLKRPECSRDSHLLVKLVMTQINCGVFKPPANVWHVLPLKKQM